MRDAFEALLSRPSGPRYRRVRSEWLAIRPAGSIALALVELENVLARDERRAAAALAEELRPAGVLCLRWHVLSGELARRMGDLETAAQHRLAYDSIRRGILATGNGTRSRPYLIADPSDALEQLRCSGLEAKSQSIVYDNGRTFDVWLVENEREFWFDITDVVPTLAENTAKTPVKAASRRKSAKRSRAVSRSSK